MYNLSITIFCFSKGFISDLHAQTYIFTYANIDIGLYSSIHRYVGECVSNRISLAIFPVTLETILVGLLTFNLLLLPLLNYY